MSIRNILVGIDGRERSSRALAFSAGLARRESAVLSVCYVRPYTHWPTLVLTTFPMVPLALSGKAANAQETAFDAVERAVSDEAAATFASLGVRGDVFLRAGDIVGELARLADERFADLIVVGTPRRARPRFVAAARRLTHDFSHGILIAP